MPPLKKARDDTDRAAPSQLRAEVPQDKRATEYLANERTFLAWIRTSIALIGIGFALTRLRWQWLVPNPQFRTGSGRGSLVMGSALMAFGALVAVLAVWRYHVVNRAIEHGSVKADRGLVLLVTLLVVFLSAGAIIYTLVVE